MVLKAVHRTLYLLTNSTNLLRKNLEWVKVEVSGTLEMLFEIFPFLQSCKQFLFKKATQNVCIQKIWWPHRSCLNWCAYSSLSILVLGFLCSQLTKSTELFICFKKKTKTKKNAWIFNVDVILNWFFNWSLNLLRQVDNFDSNTIYSCSENFHQKILQFIILGKNHWIL